jgi:GNAT superfamily N-acetyltransferase
MAKQPLYPHKTPSQLALETVHITKETTGYNDYELLLFQVGFEHPILPEGTGEPVFYYEILAEIDNTGKIDYFYIPSLKVGYIAEIHVEKLYQRRGWGRKLLEFAVNDMKKQGITKVAAGNVTQMGYYLFKALGFSFINEAEPFEASKNI